MARPETFSQESLRHVYNYWDMFDVALIADFESERAKEKFDFYEKIGEAVTSIGKRIFLPHKHIEGTWEPEKVYAVPNNILIPSLDLVLFYAGLAHTDPGIMVQRAAHAGIPVLCFYNISEGEEAYTITKPLTTCIDTIIYENETRAVERIKETVKKFYEKELPA